MHPYYSKNGSILGGSFMELKDIRELIEMINSSELAYFELKMDDNYIKMDKSLTRNLVDNVKTENASDITNNNKNNYSKDLSNEKVKEDTEDLKENIVVKEEENLITVTSPMVGTFYGAQSQGSDPFVTEGTNVSKGDVLCIVEAMKLMNEIECEYNGEIVKVLIKDGDMVEYGQPMFKLRRG